MDDLDSIINSVRAEVQTAPAPMHRDPLDDVIDSVRMEVQPQSSPAQTQLSPGATFSGGFNLPNQVAPGPTVAAPPEPFAPPPLMAATNLQQPSGIPSVTQQQYQGQAQDAQQQAYQNWQRGQVANAAYARDPNAAFQQDFQRMQGQLPPVNFGQEAQAVGGRIRAGAAETLTGIGAALFPREQDETQDEFTQRTQPSIAENVNTAARQLAQEQQAANPVRSGPGLIASEGALLAGKLAAGVAAGPAAPVAWGALGMGEAYNRAANEMDQQVKAGKATPEQAQRVALNASGAGAFIGFVSGMIPGFGKIDPNYAVGMLKTALATGGQSVADDLVARGYQADPKKLGQILQDGATAAAFGAVMHSLFHMFSLAPGDPLAAEGAGIPRKVVDIARERWDLYRAGKVTLEEARRPVNTPASDVRIINDYFQEQLAKTPEPQPNKPVQPAQEAAPVAAPATNAPASDQLPVPKQPAPERGGLGLVGQPPGPTAVGGFPGQTPVRRPTSITDPFGDRNPQAVAATQMPQPQRNYVDIVKDGTPMRATVTTTENPDGGYTVKHIKLGDPATGRYETIPVPPGQFDNYPTSADAREAINQFLEQKYPPQKGLPDAAPTPRNLREPVDAAAGAPVEPSPQARPQESGQQIQGQAAQPVRQENGSAPGESGVAVEQRAGLLKPRDVAPPPMDNLRPTIAEASMNELKRTAEHFGISPDDTRMNLIRQLREIEVEQRRMGTLANDQSLFEAAGSPAPSSSPPSDWIGQLSSEIVKAGGKVKRRYAKDVVEPAQPDAPLHYSGISLDEVRRLTGLSEDSPALHNVGLPRASDVQVGQTISIPKGSPGANSGLTKEKGKTAKVIAVWRTAGAKERDQLLHLTLQADTGEQYGVGGKAAERYKAPADPFAGEKFRLVNRESGSGDQTPPTVKAPVSVGSAEGVKSPPVATSNGFEKQLQSALDSGDERTIAKLVNRSVAGRKYFQQQTGIKLPVNPRDAMDAIDAWAKGKRETPKRMTPEEALRYDNPKRAHDMGGTLLGKPPGNPGPPAAPPTAPEEPAPSFLDKVKGGLHRLKDSVARFSGEMFPTVTRLNRPAGEAWARAVSSDIYAKQASPTITKQIVTGNRKMDKEQEAELERVVGAILTQDRLDFIRDKAEDPNAVHTLIGAQNSPFKAQQDFNDAMGRPEVRDAVQRALEWARGEPEENFKVAQGIAPDEELPGRGRRFDIGISIKAIEPGATIGKDAVITGATSPKGTLSNPLLKKSKFGRKATGLGQAYEVNLGALVENIMRETGKADLVRAYDALVKGGIAKWGKPGDKVVEGGKAWPGFDVQRRTLLIPDQPPIMQSKRLFVRPEIASEIRQGLNVDATGHSPTLEKVGDVLNRTALAGVSEAFFHLGNQLTALMRSPSMGSRIKDWERKFGQLMLDDPRISAQLMDLARIGALKPGQEGSMKNPLNWMGKVIELFDHTGRMVLDDEWKSMRDKGQVPDTETSRRDYLNAFGQYNHRAQHRLIALARSLRVGPFAVAGTNFLTKGVQSLGMSPGVKATSNANAAKMRTIIFLRYAMVALALPFLINKLRRKKTGAGTGVPPWAIRLDDSPDGKVRSIDMLSLTPWKRGLNALGLLPAYRAYQQGATPGESVNVGIKAIPKAIARPFEGPLVKFGITAATGYDTEAYKKSVDTSSPWENVKAAAKGVNPLVDAETGGTGSAFGPFKITTGGPTDEGKQTRAYRLARNLARSNDEMTPEQREKVKLKFELLDKLREDEKAGIAAINQAETDGKITTKDADKLVERAKDSPIVDTFKHLPIDKALRVLRAATPDEDAELRPMLENRIEKANMTDAERTAAEKALDAIPHRAPAKAAG